MDAPFKIKTPKGLADYILKNCAKETYLIFDRKEDICVCTRCKAKKKISTMNDAEYLKHNVKHFCYECNSYAVCKEYFRGRKNITDYGRILYLTKRGRTTYAQLDEYIINYDNLMLPSVSTWTSAQYKFNSDEQIGYKHHPGDFCWYPERWTQMREIKIPYPVQSRFEPTYFYPYSKTGTDLKYANMDMDRFGNDYWEPYLTIKYMFWFLKYQSIELLEKAGFTELVKDKVRGAKSGYLINWKGKSLRKILKLSNAEIKAARKMNAGIYEIMAYREAKKIFAGFDFQDSVELFKRLPKYYSGPYDNLINKFEKYVPIRKLAKYILNQTDVRFNDYADYIDECIKLGMDVTNKKILFPEDFKKAHESTSERIRVAMDMKVKEDFIKHEHEIITMDKPYVYGGYLIRPAAGPEELHAESNELHHCVRTYVQKVASGQTSILFIRKIEEPDKPLFTLELNKNRKIVQCRGDHNCGYPDDIADFIEHWKKDVVRKIV